MIIEFKCKINNGEFKRPDWHHRYSRQPMSDANFKIEMRRLFKSHPEMHLPVILHEESLPSYVTIERGFLSKVTIDFKQALADKAAQTDRALDQMEEEQEMEKAND